MKRNAHPVAWLCIFLAICLLAIGCSDGRPKRVPAAGQVLIDGKPLKFGTISIVPDNARASGAELDENGRFTLNCFEKGDGAVLGRHKVTVNAAQYLGGARTLWHAPKKYASYETTDQWIDITEPTDNLVIQLRWDGGKPFIEQSEAGDDAVATRSGGQ